ncbi:MAG: type II toxin-antitoxin system RelE/ParE family toxin [Bacteroidetes bacterium]|jgi:plasmid stabilization system protein ParE|nr:type II toxin-antitoxin system RelE/ParE family toxin [Bacteroidota bacterium]
MVAKIIWSDFALRQLKKIHNYYKIEASEKIAKQLTKAIVKTTIQLESNPLIGTKEPLLDHTAYEYRFLVKNNYKIIYRIDKQFIRVISVFDTRQNPEKIKNFHDK